MFKNYFKTAWRNLLRHKTDSLINIAGLCVAFTSALLLLLSVAYEFSYDSFHANAKNLYRLYFQTQRPSGTELNSAMPAPLTPSLQAAYTDIKHAVRNMDVGTVIRYKNKKLEKDLKYTGADFFSMFSFPVVEGDKVAPLGDKKNVVLRKATATAIFGTENPIGKVVELQLDNEWKPFTVSAVVADYPGNSSLTYDIITRFENVPSFALMSAAWDNQFHDVFIELSKGVSPSSFENKLTLFVQQHYADDIERLKRDGARPGKDGQVMKLRLQPLTGMHTNTSIGQGGSIDADYLFMLAVIAVLILLIACINFINLSIGKSFTRAKEIGLRKTLGASRNGVALQFWCEALLLYAVAFILSCVFAYLLLPEYKLLFNMNIQRSLLQSPTVWLLVVLSFVGITIIAGGYPALQTARLQIVDILKGKTSAKSSGKLRNGLILFQFFVTVLLISCTLISWQQIQYLRNRPLGYNTSQVISVPVTGDVDPTAALQLMRNKLSAYPSIESVSGIYDNLGRGTDGSSRTSVMGFDYKNREIKSNWIGVSYDFVKTLDLKLVEGRDFLSAFSTDSTAVLINESMAKEIGEKSLIGLRLPVDSAKPLTVIGVLKDFNFKSLKKKIAPLTLVLDKNFNINYILIKVKPEGLSHSLELIKNVWKTVSPNGDFKGSFLDENVNRQYAREEKLMQIFTSGSLIAIALSCMGLLAMIILMISQRTKEIGIRKVLGASVSGIVMLLAKDLIVIVAIATLIASPVAWYFMNGWLQGFAYRISISWLVFAAAGILCAFIALVTISFQSVKAALANPVKSLRTE